LKLSQAIALTSGSRADEAAHIDSMAGFGVVGPDWGPSTVIRESATLRRSLQPRTWKWEMLERDSPWSTRVRPSCYPRTHGTKV